MPSRVVAFRCPRWISLGVWLLLGVFQFCGRAHGETPADVPNPLQTKRSWVADGADVIAPDTELRINRLIEAEEHRSGAEIAVVTIHSLGGLTIKDFATQLFNLWKIGKKEQNNGVLLLAAIDDRKVRIEVGTGLESTLSSMVTDEVLSTSIVPAFKNRDYGGGLLAGTQAVIAKLGGVMPASGSTFNATRTFSASTSSPAFAAPASPSGPSGSIFILMALAGVVPAVIALGAVVVVVARDKKSKIPPCPQCQKAMKPLPADQRAPYLNEVQAFEQQLGSRDWQVWSCPNCAHTLVKPVDVARGSFVSCPACHNRTARSSEQVVTAATAQFGGLSDFDLQCQWPQCGHHAVEQRQTPHLIVTTSQSSSSSSDTSFSSSSSDFGGGSSSGGGSDSSW